MTMSLVSTVTVGAGGAASIEFTNIPQSGTDLLVIWSLRHSSASARITLNNDTGANYALRRLNGDGSAVTSNSASANTDFNFTAASNYSASTTNTFSNGSVYLPNYTSSSSKAVSFDGVVEDAANGTYAPMQIVAGNWSGTSAITSIKIAINPGGTNFAQYSTASLYIITKGSGGATVS